MVNALAPVTFGATGTNVACPAMPRQLPQWIGTDRWGVGLVEGDQMLVVYRHQEAGMMTSLNYTT
ncbi:MAG: hypothetical protein QOH54_5248 [Mycobacterium sp.]|jgi:hypothetical protein|nr:hypothetical protein [Mycobacterium sp.]